MYSTSSGRGGKKVSERRNKLNRQKDLMFLNQTGENGARRKIIFLKNNGVLILVCQWEPTTAHSSDDNI